MDKESFRELNTFGMGRWLFFESQKHSPETYEQNCKILSELFQGTEVCVKDQKYSSQYLKDNDFFVFVDNNNKPQIIGDLGLNYGVYGLTNIRGTDDKKEQNIAIKYVRVANEFFRKNPNLDYVKNWKYQVNWIVRLKRYNYLLKTKQYHKININSLLEDLGYNGYSLHYERHYNQQGEVIEEKYYPAAKRRLFKQPMLKPLIARYLGCKPGEVFVGKYFGNGKKIKFVVGDLMSSYLSKDCAIEKVFGSVDIKNYQGEFSKLFSLPSTEKFSVHGDGNAKLDVADFFNGLEVTEIDSQTEWER
ncbi:MAG: hypothetical protein IJA69_03425 [Clostridia bacterium]|nr:hypothetical protein [Clostridia bacterium]